MSVSRLNFSLVLSSFPLQLQLLSPHFNSNPCCFSLFPTSLSLSLKPNNNRYKYHTLCTTTSIFTTTDATHYEVFVDASENSLLITVQHSEYMKTLLDTNSLYGMIKPSETIWYIDDAQLVVNLKKQDPGLKWPDLMESWESLTTGVIQLLKGTSVFLVGESTEINYKIAQELTVGLRYTRLSTKELLEKYIKQSIESWASKEGYDAVVEAEGAILESLISQARAVVATLGGPHGAVRSPNKWQHLFAGFSIWLSQSEATDEEEGYGNAEVVVKFGGWDPKTVAQASLSTLKRLLLSDQDLPS